jgi:hypothetical protein
MNASKALERIRIGALGLDPRRTEANLAGGDVPVDGRRLLVKSLRDLLGAEQVAY